MYYTYTLPNPQNIYFQTNYTTPPFPEEEIKCGIPLLFPLIPPFFVFDLSILPTGVYVLYSSQG